MMPATQPRAWDMWALKGRLSDGGCEFHEPSPHRRYTQAYQRAGQEIVRVTVTEDPDGEYWGWLSAPGARVFGSAEHPVMIYGHRGLFRMCFPYGPEAEAERGRGEILKLRIEVDADPQGEVPQGGSR